MRIIRADERHLTDFGWLRTYWLFSFASYYDPANLQFGALRVFNDDVVQPGMGFPTHPHREMEIITILLEGEMTHKDSMGNTQVIRAGEVQRMSAGTGLTHSEFNLGDRPVHFYQIWLHPDERDLTPSYDQRAFDPEEWRNRLCPVASGQGIPEVVDFHTEATIYRATLDEGQTVEHTTGADRRVFCYLTEGEADLTATIAGEERSVGLERKDQARLDPEGPMTITAKGFSEVVLIDVPSCRGFGYDRKTLAGLRSR